MFYLSLILTIIAAIVVIRLAILFYYKMRLKDANNPGNEYTFIEKCGGYKEAEPYFSSDIAKVKEAVLFLHGFSATPGELKVLLEGFKELKIPVYAPSFTGFGLSDIHLLRKVKWSDWNRDAVLAYDLLSELAEEIHVVGHSMGGLFAFLLSSQRKVSKIILTAPYIKIKKKMELQKKMLRNPVHKAILFFFCPFIEKSTTSKKLDIAPKQRRLVLNIVPANSIDALWQAIDRVDYKNAQFNELHIFVAGKDNTSNTEDFLKELDANSIKYSVKEYANSGHNILQDIDSERAISDILNIFQK